MKDKINIGCGYKLRKDFINIDIAKETGADLVLDVSNGLPFKDNYVDEIYSSHCLEHIVPCKWKFVLNEMGRISKDGAIWTLVLPFDNHWSRTNADHFRTFTWSSFSQYTTKTTRAYYLDGFLLEDKTKYPNRLMRAFYVLFPMFLKDIKFEFIVRKGEQEK